jgi:DNA replication protein DnaC
MPSSVLGTTKVGKTSPTQISNGRKYSPSINVRRVLRRVPMTKKVTIPVLVDEPEFTPLEPVKYRSFEEYAKAVPDKDERYRQQCTVPADGWKTVGRQKSLEEKLKQGGFNDRVEIDEIARGTRVCPACLGFGRFNLTERGNTEKTHNILRETRVPCRCMGWKYLWKVAAKELPPLYDFVNLWTLKPNFQSVLPRTAQAAELEYVRENCDESFLIFGPPGTGKSTISCALMHYAFERDMDYFWKNGQELPYNKTRWIWRANFDELLLQHNAVLLDAKRAPEPYVTARKIAEAREAGHTPFLIIEEVDKTKLNEHRVKFLFQLIDAMINNRGQLIMTSNLHFEEFADAISRGEEMEATGGTIVRRLIQRVHVRDYFEMYPEKK